MSATSPGSSALPDAISLGRPRPQQAPHAARCGLDLGLQQARNLGANGGEPAAPGRVDRKIELGAQAAGARRGWPLSSDVTANPAAALEVGLELADHALDLGEHDRDGRSIRRGGDARRIVALRRLDGEPDQLPGRRQPAHHQHERIGQDVWPAARRGESSSAFTASSWASARLRIWRGRRSRDQRQHVPRLEQVAQHRATSSSACGGADLAGEPPACLVVGLRRRRARRRMRSTTRSWKSQLSRSQRRCRPRGARADLFGEGLRLRRQKIAADPGPDRLERDPRDATLMLVRSRIVDQERLDRPEEQAGGIADARRGHARLAHRPAHLLQHEIAARDFVAAQQCAFELRDQQSARSRRKLPEILPQSLDGLPTLGHPRTPGQIRMPPRRSDTAASLRTRYVIFT